MRWRLSSYIAIILILAGSCAALITNPSGQSSVNANQPVYGNPSTQSNNTGKFWYMAYYATYIMESLGYTYGNAYAGLPPSAIDWDGLNFSAISLFEGNDNVQDTPPYTTNSYISGVLSSGAQEMETNNDNNGQNFNYLVNLTAEAHAHNVMILYNIQAVDPTALTTITDSDNATSTFAKNIVDYMVYRHLDGIEVDWETIPHDDTSFRNNTNRLTYWLRYWMDQSGPNYVDGNRKLLVIAAGGGDQLAYDPANDDRVDYYTPQFYGAYSTGTNHNVPWFAVPVHGGVLEGSSDTPLVTNQNCIDEWARGLDDPGWGPLAWISEGFPAGKIVIGIESAARKFSGSATTCSGSGINPVAGNYQWGLQMMGSGGGTSHWDAEAQATYMNGTATRTTPSDYLGLHYTNGEKFWVSYEDQASINAKVQYARSLGLGGIMVYEMHDDLNGSLSAPISKRLPVEEFVAVAIAGLNITEQIDNTTPNISITSPLNNSNVSGIINITANASDDVGVVGVQFLLDGINLSIKDLSAPYNITWNSSTAVDGIHNLTARARDAAGNNKTSLVVRVNVNNSIIDNTTHYASPIGLSNGSGTRLSPWNISNAYTKMAPGDTLVLLDGIYNISEYELELGPSNSNKRSFIIADAGARPIITHKDGHPPNIYLQSNATVKNVWFGAATHDPADHYIHIGFNSEYINDTFFNYFGAVGEGSQYANKYIDNRFWNCGNGTLDHAIYISNYDVPSDQGTLVEGNIFLDAFGGYSTHLWHMPRYVTIRNNFYGDVYWGLVTQGDGHVVEDEILWSNHGPGAISFLPLTSQYFYRHLLFGPSSHGIDITYWFLSEAPMNYVLDDSYFINPVDQKGTNSHNWSTIELYNNLGINATQIDDSISSINASFRQSLQQLHDDATIEGDFDKIRAFQDAWKSYGSDITPPAVAIINTPRYPNSSQTVNFSAISYDNDNISWMNITVDGVMIKSCQSRQCSYIGGPYAAGSLHNYSVKAMDPSHNIGSDIDGLRGFTVSGLNNSLGLIAAYNFNESSDRIINDYSGNNNTGLLGDSYQGALNRTANGKYGRGIYFNGSSSWTNDMVRINDSPSLGMRNEVTVEAWVYPMNNTNDNIILSKDRWYVYNLWASNNNGFPSFGIEVSGNPEGQNNPQAEGNTTLQLNNWTFVAGSYNGSVLRLYINGLLVKSTTASGIIQGSSLPLRIGGDDDYADYFNGVIDEVRVYDRALSVSEIQNDMITPIAPDTTPPNISITSPANNSAVSGNVNITASASDDVSVIGVQFMIDGLNYSTEKTIPPYYITWNTLTYTNATHNVSAKARDAAGHNSTALIFLNVNNVAPDNTGTGTHKSGGGGGGGGGMFYTPPSANITSNNTLNNTINNTGNNADRPSNGVNNLIDNGAASGNADNISAGNRADNGYAGMDDQKIGQNVGKNNIVGDNPLLLGVNSSTLLGVILPIACIVVIIIILGIIMMHSLGAIKLADTGSYNQTSMDRLDSMDDERLKSYVLSFVSEKQKIGASYKQIYDDLMAQGISREKLKKIIDMINARK